MVKSWNLRFVVLFVVFCFVGMYLDNIELWNLKCYDCFKGIYKDIEDVLLCILCFVGILILN